MSAELPHSDAAVKKATGKDWTEWREVIDTWGGADKPHPEIARYLVEDHDLDGWWSQGVTVGYERMIGRRAVGQNNDGTFQASVSKTIHASMEKVQAALAEESQQHEWLGEGIVNTRVGNNPKSVRLDDLEHGIILAAFLTAKGDEKTSVQIQADKLASKEAGDAWKADWKPRLAKLAEHLAR